MTWVKLERASYFIDQASVMHIPGEVFQTDDGDAQDLVNGTSAILTDEFGEPI